MLARYRRNGRDVDALLFDGSPASAAEIGRAFGTAGRAGGSIEVATVFGRVYAGAGCWIVRCRKSRALSVVDDREFTAHYERTSDELPFKRAA